MILFKLFWFPQHFATHIFGIIIYLLRNKCPVDLVARLFVLTLAYFSKHIDISTYAYRVRHNYSILSYSNSS